MTMITTIQPATLTMQRRAVVLLARLRRVLNGRVAAALARRERQASLFAPRQLADREPDITRFYRGPLDEVFEKIARLRNRHRLKQP